MFLTLNIQGVLFMQPVKQQGTLYKVERDNMST